MIHTFMFVRHKVSDYPKWKAVFDEFVDVRRKGGEKSYHIFHPEDEPNNLYLLFSWDTMENAKKFSNSEELKNAMMNAGVTEKPDIFFFNKVAEGKTNSD